jgi:uncharacterized metal-binding protein YceD (DUF177 family)
MIKVHLSEIPHNEKLHLCAETDPLFLGLDEAGAEALGSLFYDLEIGVSGISFFATGSLVQNVRMTCVACLESFNHEIKTTSFAMQRDLAGSELVDLTEEVREDIHLLLPMHPRCDMGGNHQCSAQFPKSKFLRRDLNFRKDPEHRSVELDSEEKSSIWSVLDQLIKH